jgi:GABA(A) receptor-associated protein
MYGLTGFKQQHSFQYRFNESKRIMEKYRDRVPVICEKGVKQPTLPNIDKQKYLIPNDITAGQFIAIIRKRMNLTANEAIFLFIDNKIISSNSNMKQVYEQSKEPDGFLYVQYSKENVFG